MRVADNESPSERLRVLGIYAWNRFWSMGEFRGAPSFFLAPQALVRAGHEVHISMPAGGDVPVTPGPSASGRAEDRAGRGSRAECYHGMALHRYRFAIDFMPLERGRLYLHLGRPFRYLYYLARASSAGFAAARDCKPDVVVGYGAWAAPVAFLVALSLGLPNVTRLFGQSLPHRGPAGLRGAIKVLLNFPEIIAFMTRCSALILHNDGSGGDKVARRFGVPAERLHFWLNGVDKNLLSPPRSRSQAKSSLGLREDAPLLLSVSRLDAEKHHERLIRAMPEVLRSSPSAVAFVFGEGPERARLNAEASRLGVSSSVRIPGAISREELSRYYKACDIFLSLSDRTNAANTTMEAMCCGACVVVVDAGDTSQTLGGEQNAFLVGKEGVTKLGALLAGLLADGDRMAALGGAAAAFAEKHIPSVEERSRLEEEAVAAAVRSQ